VLPVRYEHHLHIKNKTIPVNRLWRHVLPVRYERHLHIKNKAIPVTVRGVLQSCEMLNIPYYLENRLKDGGEVVSLRRHTTTKLLFLSLVPVLVRG
jgi:hypothetical protein